MDQVLKLYNQRLVQQSFKHNATYTLQSIVEVAGVDPLALQKAALGPANLLGPLLINEEHSAELIGLDIEEAGELLEVHGGVQAEV